MAGKNIKLGKKITMTAAFGERGGKSKWRALGQVAPWLVIAGARHRLMGTQAHRLGGLNKN